MKQKIKAILKYPLIFIAVIVIFILTLVLTSLLPREWIKTNNYRSSEILKQQFLSKVLDLRFDDYTDALMINTAYSIDPQKPFESILLDRKNYLPEKEQTIYKEVNGSLLSAKDADYDIFKELSLTVEGNISESFEYARYWHGYLVWLRPALLFLNINHIRILIIMILVILAFLLIKNLSKKIDFKYCWIIIISLFVSDYFLVGLTFQGISMFLVSMIISVVISTRFDKIKNIGPYFFVTGMLAAFFDLLTHPIITLGLPMIVYLLLKQNKEQISIKQALKIIIINSILWGIGYVLTYLTKWVLVDIFYNRGLIKTALAQFFYRSWQNYATDITYLGVVKRNFYFSSYRTIIYFIFLIVYSIFILLKDYKNININLKVSIPYLIISIMPIAWFMCMRNHDYEHAYFTYRSLLVFYLGIGMFSMKLFDK